MTGKLCYKCYKVVAGPPQKISYIPSNSRNQGSERSEGSLIRSIQDSERSESSYIHCDSLVTILKDGRTCADCAKFGWLEIFKRFKEFFIFSGKQPILDWQSYSVACQTEYREKTILALAVSFGILSYSAAGNWEIISDTYVNLNPDSFGGKIFFVHFKDASVFAGLRYSNTFYSWSIRRINEVVPREIVLAIAQTI